jgi:hypothetical protein
MQRIPAGAPGLKLRQGEVMDVLRRTTPGSIRPYARRLLWKYRKATSARRPLPDFIIIGAQKSGTTSLFSYLSQHPQLVPSSTKEVHFFDGGVDPEIDNFRLGESWYRAHFPLGASMRGDWKSFEASPLYIFNPLVAGRMHRLLPEAKLIALLRNPTERAISHYFHVKRRRQEPLSLSEAVTVEEERLRPIFEREDYKNEVFINHSYKSRGLYDEQLARFQRLFPHDHMLVLSSEEFFRDPQRCLRQVFRFVNVDADFKVPGLEAHNVADNKGSIDEEIRVQLDKFFLSHNQRLYERLGRDFGW